LEVKRKRDQFEDISGIRRYGFAIPAGTPRKE